MTDRIQNLREMAINEAEENEFVSAIRFEAWPKAVGYGVLDDVYDSDEDSIAATSQPWFPIDGEGLVQAIFAQGTAPSNAARVLRKFADMLDGPHGHDITNMGLGDNDLDYAQRLEFGDVEVISRRIEARRSSHQQDEEEED